MLHRVMPYPIQKYRPLLDIPFSLPSGTMFNISTSSKHILSALSMMHVQGHIQYGRLPKMCCICSSNYGSGLLVSKAHQREPVTDIWLPGLSACCSRPMVFVRSHRECITYSILTTCIVPNIPPTS